MMFVREPARPIVVAGSYRNRHGQGRFVRGDARPAKRLARRFLRHAAPTVYASDPAWILR